MNKWLVRNDEKRYFYLMSAKNLWTLRRRVNPEKETIIGRADKLSTHYASIARSLTQAGIGKAKGSVFKQFYFI